MVAAELQVHELNGRDRLMCAIALPLAWLRKNATGKGWMPNRINGESRNGYGVDRYEMLYVTPLNCVYTRVYPLKKRKTKKHSKSLR
ncbi:hypothetical protein VNF293_17960 [Atlantibacter hermannii]